MKLTALVAIVCLTGIVLILPSHGEDGAGTPNIDWSKPNCQAPSSHPEADLCQQVRMSNSADQTVQLTASGLLLNKLQLMLGLATLVGLIFTVVYARRAATYARDAATQANIGNSILRSEHRAWIDFEFADGLKVDQQQAAFGDGIEQHSWIRVEVIARNIGKSIAKDVTLKLVVLKGQWRTMGEPDIYEPGGREFYLGAIGEQDGAKASHLFPDQPLRMVTVLPLDDDYLSDPQPPMPRLLPRLAVFAAYRFDGSDEIHETGKVFLFSIRLENRAIVFEEGVDYSGQEVAPTAVDEITHVS